MDRTKLLSLLSPDSMFQTNLLLLDQTDSTNDRLKRLAEEGAAEGTVLLAEEQTAGRGTQGRSFSSQRGKGLYLSLLLRPRAELSQLLTLTGRIAAAVRDGIQAACGAPAAIKWLNDIWLSGRKLCGILTELGNGYVVVGIGINVSQTDRDWTDCGLSGTAISLEGAGFSVTREELAASVLRELEAMYRLFPAGLEDSLHRYRAHCITPGRAITFPSEGRTLTGTALTINDDFSLLAADTQGRRHTIRSGTVTQLCTAKEVSL